MIVINFFFLRRRIQNKQGKSSYGTYKSLPIALRKLDMRISVFLTSLEYTSEPTIGQKGTLVPSS